MDGLECHGIDFEAPSAILGSREGVHFLVWQTLSDARHTSFLQYCHQKFELLTYLQELS